MGIVGSVSAIEENKLKEYIEKPDGNKRYGNENLYMDKSFWDIHYVLTEFFEEAHKKNNKNLIYGAQRIKDFSKGDEQHFAYSDVNETFDLYQIIKEYSQDEFEKYLDIALTDKKSFLNSYNGDEMFREMTIQMFEKLKSLYEKAAYEKLSMIYVFG